LRKDDRIDALAIMVAHFTEIMNQDASKKAGFERERLLEASLQKHLKACLGNTFRRRKKKW
jgi:hypothetical protein